MTQKASISLLKKRLTVLKNDLEMYFGLTQMKSSILLLFLCKIFELPVESTLTALEQDLPRPAPLSCLEVDSGWGQWLPLLWAAGGAFTSRVRDQVGICGERGDVMR